MTPNFARDPSAALSLIPSERVVLVRDDQHAVALLRAAGAGHDDEAELRLLVSRVLDGSVLIVRDEPAEVDDLDDATPAPLLRDLMLVC